ncbi:MAG: hypothetical protein ACP5TV_10860 [Anaerolineae bacterium]
MNSHPAVVELIEQSRARMLADDCKAALELAEQALALARAEASTEETGAALICAANIYLRLGNYERTRRLAE